jgi:asparagine synthase (glutamine-hydrolysing)
MAVDAATYLPDDILVKIDRATMAVSLEGRVPLLDHRVAELAWTLPASTKMSDGVGKLVLRGVLQRYVPAALFERPKSGFGVPIGRWIRGPLRAWASDLLSPELLRRHGLIDPAPVEKMWRQHLDGTHDRTFRIWSVLMFQAWMSRQAALAA